MRAINIRLAAGTLALALLAGFGLAISAAGGTPAAKEKKNVSSSSLYPARFAGPRRDSAIAASAHAKGRIEWSRDLGLAAADAAAPAGAAAAAPAGAARELLVWNTDVVVVASRQLILFSAAGQRRWERGKSAGTPAAVGDNGLLYHVSRENRLEAVDAANVARLTAAPFPGLASAEFEVRLLWPRDQDFVSATYMARPTHDVEDRTHKAPRPVTLGRRTVYGKAIGAWGQRYEGRLRLGPLLIAGPAGRDRWVIATDEVIAVDLGTEEEGPPFKLPMTELVDWSADADGVLCISGYIEGRKALVAMSLAGDERWRWIDHEQGDRWATTQPPIRGRGGRVLALTEGRVLAIDAGKLAWQYDVMSASLRHGAQAGDGSFEVKDGRLLSTGRLRHGSALADGSVLVVGNKTLRQLDAEGRLVFSIDLEADIVTPPVVDAEGSIYVATATHLVKVR